MYHEPEIKKLIFEEHLYVRTENKKWKWRLFRFDGTRLTCLKKFETSYIALDSIDMRDIVSISLLRKAKRPPMSFSIQTADARHVLKAARQADLERWLFVLTKMWTVSHEPPSLLSEEKYRVIETWRRSLAELMAYDPRIRPCPPPIEPIPEDDNLSLFTDMTSVSRRRVKKVRRSIKRPTKVIPLLEETSTLKKRRSNDVRHWMGKSERKGSIIKSQEEEEMSLADVLYKMNLNEKTKTMIPHLFY